MNPLKPHTLSRRERQIMDVIYRLGEASAADVLEQLPDPPGYSAVRAMLRILEEKRFLVHRQDGGRYVYRPSVNPEEARQNAVRHLVDTFFDGSPASAAAALLNLGGRPLSENEYQDLLQLIAKARQEGR